MALHRARRHGEAERAYAALLAARPDDPQLLYLIGLVRLEQGRLEAGAADMRRLVRLRPQNAAAHHALGKALATMGRAAPAERHLARALALEPGRVDSRLELGLLMCDSGRAEAAERLLRDGLAATPGNARLWTNLGEAMRRQRRETEAFEAWSRALALDPSLVEARINAALAVAQGGRASEAAEMLRTATRHNVDSPDLWYMLGNLESYLGRHEEAVAAFNRALALRPAFRRALVRRAEAAQYLCDWDAEDAAGPALEAEIAGARAGGACLVSPFFAFSLPTSEADRRTIAEAAAREREAQIAPLRKGLGLRHRRPAKDRLHVAYLSPDWRNHPNAHAMCDVFRLHDRSRFEITALSTGPDDGSEFRRAVEQGAERFVDLTRTSNRDAAQAIHDLGVDILVDVQGYTGLARPDIMALRPAPVQVLYQAYCGTMGSPSIDYLVADRTVVPDASRAHYSEALVMMPDCYMVGNGFMRVSPRTFGRADEGLPETGVVFCSFCGGFKITRDIFTRWMRVLGAVPGSVLWLLGGPERMKANLRAAASAAGVEPDRLVFATRRPKDEHLARHRLADLFLDTPLYCAHVSGMDALFVGVPILTRYGDVFTGRVSSSCLRVLGMDELITPDFDAYERLAVALGNDPTRLAALKDRLGRAVATGPLFDTARWVRHIERAWQMIRDHRLAGEKPADITVPPVSR